MTAVAYGLRRKSEWTLVEVEEYDEKRRPWPTELTSVEAVPETAVLQRLEDIISAVYAPSITTDEMPQPMIDSDLQADLEAFLERDALTTGLAGSGVDSLLRRMDVPVVETAEMAWLHEHPEIWTQLAGTWIAVKGGKVLASGPDPQRVLNAARETGIENPLVFKVPPLEMNHFYGDH